MTCISMRGAFAAPLVIFTIACGGVTTSSVPHHVPAPGAAIDRVLAPQTARAFQSEVLVLATSHLAGHREDLRPEHLEPLLTRLVAFAPTRIAIEALSADEVALLAEREAHEPAAAEVLGMFAKAAAAAGRTMQQAMAIDRIGAEQHVRARLAGGAASLTHHERLDLVRNMLAAYESMSATLQWSYLPPEVRDQPDALPADIQGVLNRRLENANEIFTIALPLARRLGLQQLYSIDSQYDGVRILAAPRDALTQLLTDPARRELLDKEREARADSVKRAAFAAGDLMPLYLHINSPEYQLGDVAQWNWLFQGRHPNGMDRLRYALWELRNLRQATHIIDVAASRSPERVLVIVGSSHKAYLERILASQLSVRLVQLDEVEQMRSPTERSDVGRDR